MKAFALLLFSLQLTAPALLAGTTNTQVSHSNDYLIDTSHHQNLLYSIFAEELTESEIGRENQKDIILFNDFSFSSTLLRILNAESTTIHYLSHKSEKFDIEPSLFKLHCTFLI